MKKKIFSFLSLLFILSSCEKKCISCIAETNSGKIVNYSTECDTDTRYLDGYYEGLKQYYKEHGDTVTVNCAYGN
jgi:hypothetical protein